MIGILIFVNLLAAALLAGEEFAICYGIRKPLGRLDAGPQIQLRQSLIRTLRILVPSIFGVALASGLVLALLTAAGTAQGLRLGGVVALLAFISVTLAGTVPINKSALAWNPQTPPANWRASVARWEQMDVVRTWVAILALCFFLLATIITAPPLA